MKKVSLLALMLFVSFVSNSQTTDTSYSKGSNFVGGTHGYLVVFCGYDLLDVMPKFSAYLTRWRDYTSVDFNRKSTPSENRISSSSYKTRIGNSTVNVSYYGRILNQEKMIVDKCIINGTWNEVANIFIQYWQTKMQFSELKSQTDIIKYTISDKVSFSTLSNGTAQIVVLKSK